MTRPKSQPPAGANLTAGPVEQTLLRLTLPMCLGTFSIIAFNFTDTYFVSGLGTRALAAISFTFPVVIFIGSIAIGLGVGTSVVISQAVGAGNRHQAKRTATDGLLLAVLSLIPFMLIGLATIDPLFTRLGAGPELLPDIHAYMRIWYLGILFVVVPMVGNNAMRATGDMIHPALIMTLGAGINIILDPLLIYGWGNHPGLGMAGAALATVIARTLTLTAAVYVLYAKKRLLIFARPRLAELIRSWRAIMHVGIPAAAMQMILPLSMGIFMTYVARFGPTAVAAVGAGIKIEGFALVVIMALSSILVPFIGQNWGAAAYHRAAQGLKRSSQFAVLWGLGCVMMLAAAAVPLARIFSRDPLVLSRLQLFLRIVPWGYGLLGVSMLAGSAFNAIKKPARSAALSLLRLTVFFLPLLHFGTHWLGFPGLLSAVALSNILAGITGWFWARQVLAQAARSLRPQARTADLLVAAYPADDLRV